MSLKLQIVCNQVSKLVAHAGIPGDNTVAERLDAMVTMSHGRGMG